MYIDITENIKVNETNLYVSIRSRKQNSPLLLYLHGGPGDSALPLVLKYNQQLEEEFTVVILEQRGAGKSYYKFQSHENITIQSFVEDAYQLSLLLLKRFQKDKLFLIGHSWGSVIGLHLVKQHPEIIEKYVGCGQVVNMKQSSKNAYDFVVRQNTINQNYRKLKRLKQIDPSYSSKTWFKDLLYVTKEVVRYEGSFYGASNYNQLIKDVIFSKSYRLKDILSRQKGAKQSILLLWPELMFENFENDTRFYVPILFIQGRHDIHVDSNIVYQYSKTIESDVDFVWFEESSHFPQWEESKKFNQLIIHLLKR